MPPLKTCSPARRELRVPSIVDAGGDEVFSGPECSGDVERKPGVSAAVLADAHTIHEHVRHLKCRLELEKYALAPPPARHLELLAVPARADIELVAAGEVRDAEGVWQVNRVPEPIVVVTLLGAG